MTGEWFDQIDYGVLVPQAGNFDQGVLPNSNQLDTVAGPVAKEYDYDAAGNGYVCG